MTAKTVTPEAACAAMRAHIQHYGLPDDLPREDLERAEKERAEVLALDAGKGLLEELRSLRHPTVVAATDALITALTAAGADENTLAGVLEQVILHTKPEATYEVWIDETLVTNRDPDQR